MSAEGDPSKWDVFEAIWSTPLSRTIEDDSLESGVREARREQVRVEFDDAEARWREETRGSRPVAFAVDGGHAMMFEGDTARERILSDRYVEDVQ